MLLNEIAIMRLYKLCNFELLQTSTLLEQYIIIYGISNLNITELCFIQNMLVDRLRWNSKLYSLLSNWSHYFTKFAFEELKW